MAASDCGCWTDEDGFWVLSNKCLQAELQTWRDMMDRWRGQDLIEIPNVPTTPHERAVAYFRQELRNDLE